MSSKRCEYCDENEHDRNDDEFTLFSPSSSLTRLQHVSAALTFRKASLASRSLVESPTKTFQKHDYRTYHIPGYKSDTRAPCRQITGVNSSDHHWISLSGVELEIRLGILIMLMLVLMLEVELKLGLRKPHALYVQHEIVSFISHAAIIMSLGKHDPTFGF